MKITAIKLHNIRGFQAINKTEFSEGINVFIGPNNAGKSTLLNAIFLLQRPTLKASDITIGEDHGQVELFISGGDPSMPNRHPNHDRIICNITTGVMRFGIIGGKENLKVNRFTESEPSNLIYPYLSKRKTFEYNESINEVNVNSVSGNFSNLYAKIDRLVTPQFQPGNKQYVEACKQILGFEVSSLALGGGKKAVYFIHNNEHIPLTAMGEGVANILGLIVDLCIAENKIFLIEEPENDIHPKALKALLRLIIDKAQTNQFFISTHSNIVMKYLGGADGAKIFNVTNEQRDDRRPNMFLSSLKEISNQPEERRQILEDLGYDFFDFDLWKGWLFLEESSAEVIIRDYLIQWFVPSLKNQIRTFSAGGASKILTKFEDFDRLFVYLHLEKTYKNRVWVLIDGGEEENKIVNQLRSKYAATGWKESNFSQFSEHNFEKYYPEIFKDEVERVLKITDKQAKRQAKNKLLAQVKSWIAADEASAKAQFKESAKEVIQKLKEISKQLNG